MKYKVYDKCIECGRNIYRQKYICKKCDDTISIWVGEI